MHRGFMSDQQERKRNVNKLADLKPDRNNARKHNPRNIGMVANSLREVGAARSGVIDEDGNILAGNGTYEALSEAGIEKVKIVQADGNEWVVVQRKGLSEKQKLKLALYDNRSAELAEWDKDVLADIDPEIMESMFSTDELEDLLDSSGGGELKGEDKVPEAPEKAISQLGDLYQLGQHRLLCGDSTAKDAVDKLMDGQKADMVFTDPPYGINVVGGAKPFGTVGGANTVKANTYPVIQGDHSTDLIRSLYPVWFDSGIEHYCLWGGNYFADFLPPSKGWIVWDKKGRKWDDNFSDFEMAWTSFDKPAKILTHVWMGLVQGGEREKRVHPTQKPVGLLVECLNYLGKEYNNIYDPFGGSGSTLIASEKLNRKCYMMELDPQYCDVIVKRFNGLFPEIEILRNGEAFEPIHE